MAKLDQVYQYSTILLGLTTIHHIYGAIIFNTPWRLHVVLISIPVLILILLFWRKLKKQTNANKTIYFKLFWILVAIPTILLIGIFEGIYNHAIKNILYFGNLSTDWMLLLFPPPTYEMPNELFFEITGCLQGIIVLPLLGYFISLTRQAIDKSV